MQVRTINGSAGPEIEERVRAVLRWLVFRRREILAVITALLIVFTAGAAFELYSDYLHYATVVDTQIERQSLQRPPGVYAAPRHLSVGQRLSPEELKERLLRAGYQEGGHAIDFASGDFVLEADTIEARTNEYAHGDSLPELTRIRFSTNAKTGSQIIAIEDLRAGRKLQSLRLPAELITADLNAKIQTRSFADFSQFPPVLIKAITAVEDRNFFTHSGLDLRGICRALVRNQWYGEIREGGSTITQQLVKTLFLTPKRSWERKYAEAMMALAIERRLSKEQIFTLYANRVYLGSSGITMVYGFKQAAQVYFGKDLSELSLGEAALLAGLAQAPSRYAPSLHPDAAIARRNVALQAMVDAGSVSAAEAEAARTEQVVLAPTPKPDKSIAPHFLDFVGRELAKDPIVGEENAHLQIETSLDADLQQAANQTIQEHLAKLDKIFARRTPGARPEAALIAIDPHTGEILAMVGGRDYTTSQLNRVTDAKRQPGSLFKPIVYAAALNRGFSPTTTFSDAPQQFDFGYKAVYRPQNYGRSYSNRPVMLRDGVVRSLNVVAVQAALQVGLSNVADMAERAGLPRPELYPSMALGAFEATPLELAMAYTVFANSGLRVSPIGIKAIRSSEEVIRETAAPKAGVLSSAQAYVVTDTLADVVNYGTAARIRQMGYQGPAAGKTGSSHDAWFAGYTPNLLVVVWVGFDDYRDLGLTGGEAAAPIWADFIKSALALRPDLQAAKFSKPAGLETVDIDPANGLIANEYCPQRRRLLLPSYLLPGNCFEHHAETTSEPELTFDTQPVSDEDER